MTRNRALVSGVRNVPVHIQQLHWLLNLLNTGSTLEVLTLLSNQYFALRSTHSLYIYIPSCAFTLLLVP